MFTGIIEGLGKVVKLRPREHGTALILHAPFSLNDSKIGDSFAVNGACLTAIELEGSRLVVDVSPETLTKTVIRQLKPGSPVNLERALRLSDRLDGHLVSGHVDGVGWIVRKQQVGNSILVRIEIPEELARYVIKKGSVALDGISLTINEVIENTIEVSIIPHTAKATTIGFKEAGDQVNIETDMIGKYIERFLLTGKATNSSAVDEGRSKGLTMGLLAENGFM
jgi:riboflavin synthase